MSLNAFGAIVGVAALVAVLVFVGHEKAKHEPVPAPAPQVVVPAPAPPPPVSKPSIVSRIFKSKPKPVAKPVAAKPAVKPAAPAAQGTIKVFQMKQDGSLDLTKPTVCKAVVPYTQGWTDAQVAAKAKELGTTPAILKQGVNCIR
jgi:hypothetical protein